MPARRGLPKLASGNPAPEVQIRDRHAPRTAPGGGGDGSLHAASGPQHLPSGSPPQSPLPPAAPLPRCGGAEESHDSSRNSPLGLAPPGSTPAVTRLTQRLDLTSRYTALKRGVVRRLRARKSMDRLVLRASSPETGEGGSAPLRSACAPPAHAHVPRGHPSPSPSTPSSRPPTFTRVVVPPSESTRPAPSSPSSSHLAWHRALAEAPSDALSHSRVPTGPAVGLDKTSLFLAFTLTSKYRTVSQTTPPPE